MVVENIYLLLLLLVLPGTNYYTAYNIKANTSHTQSLNTGVCLAYSSPISERASLVHASVPSHPREAASSLPIFYCFKDKTVLPLFTIIPLSFFFILPTTKQLLFANFEMPYGPFDLTENPWNICARQRVKSRFSICVSHFVHVAPAMNEKYAAIVRHPLLTNGCHFGTVGIATYTLITNRLKIGGPFSHKVP